MSDPHEREPELTSMHVRQVADGDRESLAWVISRFSPLLFAQAQYHLQDFPTHDPDDLVNETWATALPKLVKMEPGRERFTPAVVKFLSTTLLFLVKNELRKTLRHAAKHDADDAVVDEIPADSRGVVTRVVATERESEVMRCIDELPPTDREVIVLRGIEQRTNEVAGLLLGLSPGAVATRYTRALTRLRARLPDSVFLELDS